jgi:hypothetical protein
LSNGCASHGVILVQLASGRADHSEETTVLHLAEAAETEMVPGVTIGVSPRLSLDELAMVVGPYDSAGEHERHMLRTQGSGNDLEPDEFRFNRETGTLESLWLSVPEDNIEDPNVVSGWLGLVPAAGVLRRTDRRPFTAVATTVRWCAEDGGVLVCLAGPRLEWMEERLRLRVAEDVDLLFNGDLLAGWVLTNPERHLTSLWGQWPSRQPPDRELGVMLRQCLDLIDTPHMAALFEEEEPEGRRLLTELRERIVLDRGAADRRRALSEWLGFLDENWYGR